MSNGHHTNGQRTLYHAVLAAYWSCDAGDYETAKVVLTAGLDAAEND
jgi:hypothetical protein